MAIEKMESIASSTTSVGLDTGYYGEIQTLIQTLKDMKANINGDAHLISR